MKKVILIRYGELFLKGRNKRFFESALIDNIKNSLRDLKFGFFKMQGRYFIKDFDEDNIEEYISRLTKVFGIHSVSPAFEVSSDMDTILKTSLEVAPKRGSFRVTVNRADKTIPMSSTDISREIGGYILENRPALTVDLHTPDNTVNIDIREGGYAYVFSKHVMGVGGMPVGTAGNGLLLLSGGIDSPVAGYKMAQRGMELNAIYFHSDRFVSEQAKQKVIDLATIVSGYAGNIRLFVLPFSDIQEAIHNNCKEEFMITIMRRFMMEIAEKIAMKSGCGALVTGESLGQVASQTMESILVSNNAVELLPVFRPLIGMDKSEIMDISLKIGAYDTSIRPYADCCTAFLPKNPVIKPRLEVAIAEQMKIANKDELIDEAIRNVEVIKIGNSGIEDLI